MSLTSPPGPLSTLWRGGKLHSCNCILPLSAKRRGGWGVRFLFSLLLMLSAGCLSVPPIEPTVARLPTDTVTPAPTPTPDRTVTLPTLPPTWTPAPTKPLPPTVTLLPTDTLPPATATHDPIAEAPLIVTRNGRGLIHLKVTEAQLNAALARHFDAAPLDKYTAAPRAMLTQGSLDLLLLIIPSGLPDDALPQPMTLTVTPAIYAGTLELRPTHLAPLDAGVSTRQVKPAQALLQQTLSDLVIQAAGLPRAMAYNDVSVQTDGITLTVAIQP